MALINCPECNHEVSNHAKSCPHCGYPIATHIASCKEKTSISVKDSDVTKKSSSTLKSTTNKSETSGLGCFIFIVVIFLFLLTQCTHSSNDSDLTDTLNKDPNTWTEREEENVNDFFEWQKDYYEDN